MHTTLPCGCQQTGQRPAAGVRMRRPGLAQRGQALVLGLVFTMCTGLIVLMLFNSSLLTITKSNLQNAADAGAYSAAVLQARDANFSAYTNRAMIANQVAVAQFVSLKSYFQDAERTHTRTNSFLHDSVYRLLPSAAPIWDLAKKVPIPAAKSAMDSLAPTAVKALDLLIAAMDNAQQIHHLGTAAEMMFVANDVVKKNDPEAKVTTSAFMLGDGAFRVTNWANNATKRFKANDASKEADRFADAVVHDDSQDGFTRNRISAPAPFWASTVKPYLCPLAVSTFTTFAYYHGGGTNLSANKRRWMGLDATMGGGFATCTWLVPCFPTGLCPVTVTVPFPDIGTSAPFVGGHGGAMAGSVGGGYAGEWKGYKNNAFSSWGYGFALTSPASVPALYRFYAAGPGSTLDSSGGLQDHYRDVADPTNASKKPKNQSAAENGGAFPVTLEVERPGASLRTSTELLPDASQLKLDKSLKGNTMRALASGHAYFYRPLSDNLSQFTRNGWQRGDSRTEYQNQFSPYWQARLTDTSAVEVTASIGAQ